MLISFTHVLTHASSTFVCFLELLLTQLHADLCVNFSGCLNSVAGTGCLNLVTETVVYRKLLSEASAELSKTSKLTAVIISFYLMSVCCQFTSSTIFLQSLLQLFIVLVSLSVQSVVKLEFDSLVLSICHSQFRELITTDQCCFRIIRLSCIKYTESLKKTSSDFLYHFLFNHQ